MSDSNRLILISVLKLPRVVGHLFKANLLVTINMWIRSSTSRAFAAKHSANSELDNCYRDYAQRNARELAELLGE